MNKTYFGDFIFEKIGGHGYYQIILSLILTIIGASPEGVFVYLAFQETPPIVDYTDSKGNIIEAQLDYNICNLEFKINYIKSLDTWLLQFGEDIYCSKFKVTLLAISLCLGGISAALLVRTSKYTGNKISLIIFSMLLSVATFLVYIKNYWPFFICHYFYGISSVSVFMLRNTIMAEHTSKQYRSYFIYCQIISSLISGCLFYYFFQNKINWRYVYGGNAICIFIFTLLFYFYSVENPRYYLINYDKKNSKINLVKSIRYIGKINRKSKEEIEEVVNFICENLDNVITPEDDNRKITSFTRHFPDSCMQHFKNDIDNQTSLLTEQEPAERFRILRVIAMYSIFFVYVILNILLVFEAKYYAQEMEDYFYISNIAGLGLMLLTSFCINLKPLGRRYVIIFFYGLALLSKIIKMSFIGNNTIALVTYLIIRNCAAPASIPCNVLVTESLTTKERVKTYGMLYLYAKIVCLAGPWLMEYLTDFYYSLSLCFLFTLSIISTIILKETLGKSLKDL